MSARARPGTPPRGSGTTESSTPATPASCWRWAWPPRPAPGPPPRHTGCSGCDRDPADTGRPGHDAYHQPARGAKRDQPVADSAADPDVRRTGHGRLARDGADRRRLRLLGRRRHRLDARQPRSHARAERRRRGRRAHHVRDDRRLPQARDRTCERPRLGRWHRPCCLRRHRYHRARRAVRILRGAPGPDPGHDLSLRAACDRARTRPRAVHQRPSLRRGRGAVARPRPRRCRAGRPGRGRGRGGRRHAARRTGRDRRGQAPDPRRHRAAGAARPGRAAGRSAGRARGPGGADRVPGETGPGMDIRRILIANRGEIAVRVIRACRELGIDPIAAYEPDDRGAVHVALAAEAREVDSYLDADALVAAAEGCDAVHPGYGYLAENADFAEAVARAGLRWIGPPASAMRALGDKIEARRLAEAAGVPVMPGYAGVLLDDDTLVAEGLRLGSPLLVKAAAGGGGRGMREVDDPADLAAAIAAARREAAAAFGDDRVFLERRLAAARHVEVQILCDSQSGAVHLGERDCSIQRRHQKIIEESPSPAVGGELRSQLGEAALAVAVAAGYEGAGTVEFLLDADGGWWFLELNARLPLELEQADVVPRGHAIECRLYAEDPAAGFLPATGTLHRFRLPTWPGVRCDSGVREGDTVGTRYDPLLAKLIAHAGDRDACVEKLSAALADTVVLGVTTNLGFLRWALGHRRFRSGEATTAFVAEEWSPGLVPPLPEGAAAAGDDLWHQLADDGAGDDPELIVEGEDALYRGWAHRLGADDQEPVAIAAAPGSLSAPMPGTVL